MNSQQRERQRLDTSNQYHTPGCSKTHRRPWGAIYLSTANTIGHELKKCEVALDLMMQGHEIITEAVRDELDDNGKERRVDVVDLDTGDEYEIETDMKRATRFLNDPRVIIIPCGWNKQDEKWKKLTTKA